MRTFVVAVTCLLFVAASASAAGIFTDDFENYIGYTANNGNGWFNATNEPNYGNYSPLYTWGGERDPGEVVAAGGPHQGGTPSGVGNSQGMANFDGGSPHGSSMALPGGAAGPGDKVIIQADINAANGGYGYLMIGDAALAGGAGSTDYLAAAIIMPNGNLAATTNGPEPKGPVDWSGGYVPVKLEVTVGSDGNVELAQAFADEGSGWALKGTAGAAGQFQATHFAFSVPKFGTIDNLSVTVVPEPATLSMLGMSLLGLALAGRRRKNG